MTSRRNLLAGATALAAGAILPARAATLSRCRDDARLLAHAARTRTLVDRYAEVAEEAHRTFDLVQADPVLIPGTYPLAWARDEIARGSTLSTRTLLRLYQVRQNRIYERHGYRAASDAWNTAGRVTRAALGRLKAMHATTTRAQPQKPACCMPRPTTMTLPPGRTSPKRSPRSSPISNGWPRAW